MPSIPQWSDPLSFLLGVGSQASFQIFVDSPFLILQPVPSSSELCAFQMLCLVKEGLRKHKEWQHERWRWRWRYKVVKMFLKESRWWGYFCYDIFHYQNLKLKLCALAN
ncbi:uncharacterized protein LOC108483434 [Gossypium arboreum]|uniref:uncharacterized protein LOC108483434 n=1 Tax=Gossypium arboreum TaxID=29729 RepID=UPI0008193462|nr:uncharacterized protein LOC108483434 [Gossypium arboreum]XP_052885858.1 uncharacterized protein LOC108483434 [Gossypium arboreum]